MYIHTSSVRPATVRCLFVPVCSTAGRTSWMTASVPRSNPSCPCSGGGSGKDQAPRSTGHRKISQRQCGYASFGKGFVVEHDRRPVLVETRQPARTWHLGASSVLAGVAPPSWHPSRLGISAQGAATAAQCVSCPLLEKKQTSHQWLLGSWPSHFQALTGEASRHVQ